MSTQKEQAIALIEQLPETVSAETIITELQVRLLMRRRGSEAERDENVISHEEAKHRLEVWLK